MTARPWVLVVVGLLVAAVCVRLGVWQLDRLEQRRSSNAAIERGLASAPADFEGLDPDADLAYRRVRASGRWDPEHEVILYGRPLDGRPGNHVLTPLVFPDGSSLLVDRGWVPTEVDAPPVSGDAAATDGDVVVDGTLLPSAGDGTVPPSAVTTVRSVDVAALDAQVPADLVDGLYLLLDAQEPPVEAPVPAPLPELSEGPHLGYAIQWFSFAAIALVGTFLLARRRADRMA